MRWCGCVAAAMLAAGCSNSSGDTVGSTPVQDAGGSDQSTPPPDSATGQDSETPPDAAPVTKLTLLAAGDIAQSGRTQNARAIAARVKAHSPSVEAVVLSGDNARWDGVGSLLTYYNTYYGPANEADWGQFDAIAFPQLGNHEYSSGDPQGYFDYFASRFAVIKKLPGYAGFADDKAKAYYSFDLNGWHFVSLNSQCTGISGGCAAGGDQEVWLKSDLASHPNMPIIANWHSPRYACGGHTSDTAMQDLWADLVDARADFVFNGHNHYYERWKPLNKTSPEAQVDDANGLTEVIAGSYGVSTYPVCASVDARLAQQKGDDAGMGAFYLTIGSDGSYAFEYELVSDGSIVDSGSGIANNAH